MNFKEIITDNFNKQSFMQTLGAELLLIEKGKVEIGCKLQKSLTQQNGFFHAGVLTSVIDSACGYAALSMMPEGSDVLSVEFKVNLLRPAVTPEIIAIGEVLKAGKTLTVCEGIILDQKREKILVKMVATMYNAQQS